MYLMCTPFSRPLNVIVRTPKLTQNDCMVRAERIESKKPAPPHAQFAFPHFATIKKGKPVDVLFESMESVLTIPINVMYCFLVRRNHFKTKEQLWQH